MTFGHSGLALFWLVFCNTTCDYGLSLRVRFFFVFRVFSILDEETCLRIRHYYVKKKEDGKCDAIKSKLVFFVYPGLKKFRLFWVAWISAQDELYVFFVPWAVIDVYYGGSRYFDWSYFNFTGWNLKFEFFDGWIFWRLIFAEFCELLILVIRLWLSWECWLWKFWLWVSWVEFW